MIVTVPIVPDMFMWNGVAHRHVCFVKLLILTIIILQFMTGNLFVSLNDN